VRRISALLQKGFVHQVIGGEGIIEPGRLSDMLHITKSELAVTSGLSHDAVSKVARLRAPATQTRLREVAEIINRVLPWCGSVPQAFAWYRAQPLPAFGDQTAAELVRQGRAAHVMSYLGGIALGGFA
jgi:hypothetical protein